jgi:hypothetical protein
LLVLLEVLFASSEMIHYAVGNQRKRAELGLKDIIISLLGVLFASSEKIRKAVGNLRKRAELGVKEKVHNFQYLLR